MGVEEGIFKPGSSWHLTITATWSFSRAEKGISCLGLHIPWSATIADKSCGANMKNTRLKLLGPPHRDGPATPSTMVDEIYVLDASPRSKSRLGYLEAQHKARKTINWRLSGVSDAEKPHSK